MKVVLAMMSLLTLFFIAIVLPMIIAAGVGAVLALPFWAAFGFSYYKAWAIAGAAVYLVILLNKNK